MSWIEELGNEINDFIYNVYYVLDELLDLIVYAKSYAIGTLILLAIILVIQITTASSVSSLKVEIKQLRAESKKEDAPEEKEEPKTKEVHTIG